MFFSFATAPLTDDISHYADVIKLQNGEYSMSNIYQILFSDPNRYTRPMSPIILGTMMVLSQYSDNLLFLWGGLYIGYIILLYKLIVKYFSNPWLALIISILVLMFPLSSSNLFSPVMISVQTVVGTFLLSCYLSDKKNIIYYIFIFFLSLFSLLFYELNLFLFPILALLIWKNNEHKKYLKIFLATILPVIVAFSYKIFFVKLIYPDYFDYSSSKIAFSFNRVIEVFIALAKLFTTDLFYIITQSFKAIQYYNIEDYILLLIGIFISILTAIYIKPNQTVSKSYVGVAFFIFGLTIAVFFISNYPPIAFGFENRILLWIRFSSMLILGIFINNILYWVKDKKIIDIGLRLGLSLLFFSFFTSVISQKNAWIAASEYNKNMILNLGKHLPNAKKDTKVVIIENIKSKYKFIADEPTMNSDYEVDGALSLYQPKSQLKGENIIFFIPNDYSLYEILGKKLNNRYKTEYEINDYFIKFGKRELAFPFYIYDIKNNKIQLINNKKEFKIQ